jgi:hypothetical protein
MAVRSALPWPFRWLVLAVVFGFCAAVGLWAFEFGKEIAGLDRNTEDDLLKAQSELVELQARVTTLQQDRDKAQAVANTADLLLTSEKVAQEAMVAQNKQLMAENQSLRDDLGFFEKLIPTTGGGGISIRGLQAELVEGRQIKWQVLVIQPVKNPAVFNGRLELTFAGVKNGQTWTAGLPSGPQTVTVKQYGRVEGVFELPAQTTVRSVTAKILEGAVVKAVQTIKL